MKPFDLSLHFFLQLAFILAVCRLVGWLAGKLGQPQVVGEMIAGVLMGPSLFGRLAPEWQAQMFPDASKGVIFSVCQVGLAVYMFLVGAEFDLGLIRNRLRSAASVSIAGIAAPFALGVITATCTWQGWGLFSAKTTQLEAMLFMGAAMSITAFPMLARIIYERGLTGTSLGTLALAAGSMDDAAAWCVLAVVLASFGKDAGIAMLAIGGTVAYVAVVMGVIRPLMKRLGDHVEREGRLSHGVLSITLALLMIGAWFTDTIGIYAVFGAFIMGLAMPRGLFTKKLNELLEPATTTLLLPMFFIYSGLNTRLDLLNSWPMAGLALVILFFAIAGKGVACWLAALFNGEPNREAMAIGSLMNARGLMELIILNIGLQRGIITPALFTIMVLMAIVTTLMATPLFELVYGRRQSARMALDKQNCVA
ncbi:MAG: cation:proton antiporter [Chthoniobacteraceae bacterium]